MPGKTTASGLGWAHQKRRQEALTALQDGERCWRCGRPMFRAQALDLDHVRPRMLGGADGPAVLAHASCNRRAGAVLGNSVRSARRRRRRLPRWLHAPTLAPQMQSDDQPQHWPVGQRADETAFHPANTTASHVIATAHSMASVTNAASLSRVNIHLKNTPIHMTGDDST